MNLIWTKRAARIDRLETVLALLNRMMHDAHTLGDLTDDDRDLDELLDIQRRLYRYRKRYIARRKSLT